MNTDVVRTNALHEATAAALGFYYQSFFALLTLLKHTSDNAAIAVERLDDVELRADGQTLTYQLKHSFKSAPPPITLKSRALWRTVKVWIDLQPSVTLSETTLHLVAVGGIDSDDPLFALTAPESERSDLVAAMRNEARRVMHERDAARKLNESLPHGERADGCASFLALPDQTQLNLLRRARVFSGSPRIDEIESLVAQNLTLVPREQRPKVASRLVEWWDRQVVYSLCGVRDRLIYRTELQEKIATTIADIERSRLVPDFETIAPPSDYQPDGMLARQITLVGGQKSDHSRAIREEWRAREQRSKWVSEDPAMHSKIHEYDEVLREQWLDRHTEMAERCADRHDAEKCASGLRVLRWTHEEAPTKVRPISNGWNADYYVRGSYQVLAINLSVGWHPDFAELLGEDE